MKLPIYLDYHATTPVDPRVLEAMLPYFTEKFGNAASRNHRFGWEAEACVEHCRETIAGFLGADPSEILFTSGATESDNLAILGAARMNGRKGKHLITAATEHKAVLDACAAWEREGGEVTTLRVDSQGLIDLDELRRAIRPDTVLLSIMMANNEIGVIQPVEAIGAIAREREVLFHTDATQAVGKLPVDVEALHIDLMSFTAHKIYGPKGIGGLYVRKRKPRVRLAPLFHGGGHERGMRSGTLNVPGIVGLAAALRLSVENMKEEQTRLAALRDHLVQGLRAQLDEVVLNGHPSQRLAGNLNISFAFVEGEGLMMGIPEIAVSSGSACTSASLEPSYVLRALGVGDELAHSSLRFGLGRFTTLEEIDFTIERVSKAVKKLREMSPLYEMAREGIDLKSIRWKGH